MWESLWAKRIGVVNVSSAAHSVAISPLVKSLGGEVSDYVFYFGCFSGMVNRFLSFRGSTSTLTRLKLVENCSQSSHLFCHQLKHCCIILKSEY